MNWGEIAQTTADVLSVILLVRLLKLRLQHVYWIFCAFLLNDLMFSGISWFERFARNPIFDYRKTYLIYTTLGWIFSLWLVYSLLQAVLSTLPGIQRFSAKLLRWGFVSMILVSLLTMHLDTAVSNSAGYLSKAVDPIGRMVGMAMALDRVISTAALLVLALILVFVLWWAVPVPRNLAVFSIGFVIYFAANSALVLTRGVWSRETLWVVSTAMTCLSAACYAYWIAFITHEGEFVSVRVGHHWRPQEQDRLLSQLEAMNANLLHVARH